MSLVAFEQAEQIGDRFLELFNTLGIDPKINTKVESEMLSLVELLDYAKNPEAVTGAKKLTAIRAAAGMHDLAAKVLAVVGAAEFDNFIPHLQMIANANYYESIIQNSRSDGRDDVVRKMIELYLGSLAIHFGSSIAIDSPVNSKGDNPDVMFTVDEHFSEKSYRVALAIKSITSASGHTFFDRVSEAAAQIDSQRCNADIGIVIINATSTLDHDALWNSSFLDLESAISALTNQLATRARGALEYCQSTDEWDAIFKGKVVRPVLVLGQSVVRLPSAAGRETPTVLKLFLEFEAMGNVDARCHAIAHHLNHYMQTILHGIPGSIGNGPS